MVILTVHLFVNMDLCAMSDLKIRVDAACISLPV